MPDAPIQRLSRSLSAGYDKDTQELTIQFENGQDYMFYGVPPDLWEGLQKSDSPGRFYNSRIRGKY